ncbi:MAG: hypothetical protein ABIF88_02930 [archaeon]
MKLINIRYKSAVFFGIFSLILSLALGVVQWVNRASYVAMGYEVSLVKVLVTNPIISGIVTYIMVVVAILVYNFVAKKGFPLCWEISRK